MNGVGPFGRVDLARKAARTGTQQRTRQSSCTGCGAVKDAIGPMAQMSGPEGPDANLARVLATALTDTR